MKLIKADHERRLQIPGVPEPVLRPVDIDKAKTGFASLRSLRIYHFDKGSVIDGHAEEDEVLIVPMTGSIELTLIDGQPGIGPQTSMVSAVNEHQSAPCAAYLPPQGAYQLRALTDAEVAYARATPADGPPARFFEPNVGGPGRLLWEEMMYPRQLRVRILRLAAGLGPLVIPGAESEAPLEALLHVRTDGVVKAAQTGFPPASLASWDTLALDPGERIVLQIELAAPALLLVVLALPK